MKDNPKSLNIGTGQVASSASAPTPPVVAEKKKRNRKAPTTDTLVGALQIQLREARPVQRCIDEINKMSGWALAKITAAVNARYVVLDGGASLAGGSPAACAASVV